MRDRNCAYNYGLSHALKHQFEQNRTRESMVYIVSRRVEGEGGGEILS